MKRPKVGVVLSGCGYLDGAEIHESVLTMLALDKAGAELVLLAPDRPQADVVNHLTGKPEPGARNVLVESARIARGRIRDAADVKAAELDAVVLPGGYGAAKNISDFAAKGAACWVDKDVERLLKDVHAQGKPIGALCIAPVVLARLFGKEGPRLTIGADPGTAKALEGWGAKHEACRLGGVVVDDERRFASTPAYMLEPTLKELAADAEKLVAEVLRLVKKPAAV